MIRLAAMLRDVMLSGTACFYFIEQLREGVAAGYITLPDGMLWKDGQRAEITDRGRVYLQEAER
jgi:hypothetical protein